MATEADRRCKLEELFSRWDLDGNGAVEFGELMQVLQSSERAATKEQMKWVRKLEAQINQGRQFHRSRRGSSSSMALRSGGHINFPEHDGEPSLDPEAFTNFLYDVTTKDTDEEFDEFLRFCKAGVDDAVDKTQGSKTKKDVWHMFQLLDVNNDGFVDLVELEVLLNSESKADKKHVAKWKAFLINKGRNEDYIKESEVEEEDEDKQKKHSVRMSLSDFQLFVHEYLEHDEERVQNLLTAVEKAVQEKQVKYIIEFRVQDIMNDIMTDLLKERPKDPLAGVAKSVARLQRTGKYPKILHK